MEENINGFTETTNVPEGAPSEAQGSYSSPELDVERIDNVGQLRDHVKGLKNDLETYKSTHNFVNESFGDLENAKLAHQLYNGLVSEEFEPDYFIQAISDLSPTRAQKLAESYANQYAPQYAQEKIQEYFGGDVTPEEVELFRQWRDSGYMITPQEDGIPDAFKYDSYGNPLSEEQVDAFKQQFKMLNDLRSRVESQVQMSEQQRIQEVQQEIQQQLVQQVQEFDDANLKILDNDFAKVGLGLSDTDTPELRQHKEMVREFILGGVGKLFVKNQELFKNYQTALSHIENGEVRLAKRYEPKIQKGLLDIMRSEPISKLLSSFVPDAPRQARPEISSSGVSAPTIQPANSRDERIQNLVASGALKL